MSRDLSVYLVIGRDFTAGRGLLELVAEAVAGGVTLVQLREKEANLPEFTELARALKAILAPTRTPLFINDDVAVARIVGAEGIHLGQSDLPVAEARQLLGPTVRIGLSVDTREQALAAEALEVDYLGISPVFPSASKTDTAEPWGLEGLAWARAHCRHRLVGIGGISQANAAGVIRAGADGVAVISAIASAPSPRQAAEKLSGVVRGALGD
ncbi:MAG: thiamine phosphate synthase [Chthoniobacteraceae bacterium]